MYRIGFIILALAAVALGLVVGTLNSDPVSVNLLWVQINWPLGLVILLALVIGFGVGVAMTWLTQVLPARLRLRNFRRSSGASTAGRYDPGANDG